MSAKMFFKVGAAALVLCVVVLTGLFAYHVWVNPLGRVFERFVPSRNAPSVASMPVEVVVEKNVPVLDPGEQYYAGARDHVLAGRLAEAKERLGVIVANHPRSVRAAEARRMLTEINLDELLSAKMGEGKLVHCVRPGETYAEIAKLYRSDLDCLLHLNSIVDPTKIQVGQNLVVLPLDFHFVLEIDRKVISMWSGERRVCEFPVLQWVDRVTWQGGRTEISSKVAGSLEARLAVGASAYRAATKAIWLAKPVLKIMGWDGSGMPQDGAVLVGAADMEELFLLMRPGNEVEIR